jgi:predicted membrane-bound mannosyltransferase
MPNSSDSARAACDRAAPFGAWEAAALALILVIAAAVRLYGLGDPPLWLDEQCQLYVASRPGWAAVWDETRVSGPIGRASYLDSAVALRLGTQTRAAFRMPQLIEGLAAIVLVYLIGRRWLSARAGLFAAALMAASGLHILYSREARGYALFGLLVLAVAIAFDALVRKPNLPRAVVLAALTFAALSVHPLTAVAVVGLVCGALLAVVLRARPVPETRWLTSAALAAGAMCCGAALWHVVCLRGIALGSPGAEKLAHSPLYDIVDVYKALIGGYWGVGSYVALAACALAIWAGMRRLEWRWPLCLCLGVGAAAAVPVILSHATGSFVTPRYSCFAIPFFFLAAGAGLDALLTRGGCHKRMTLAQAIVPPLLALLLLGGMALQGRSPYDLERFKTTHPEWPTLPVRPP